MEELQFNSVETIPVLNASAAFKTDSGKVFKEEVDIVPTIIDKSLSYIPWGSDNNMPYHIIDLIESDETLATCQMFNAEVCYGSGLQYNTDSCGGDVKREVEDFLLDNALPSYLPRCVPGLQALCLLRLGRHPQCRGHEDCTTDPQGGLLLPSYPCGEGRQHQAGVLRQLAAARGQPCCLVCPTGAIGVSKRVPKRKNK